MGSRRTSHPIRHRPSGAPEIPAILREPTEGQSASGKDSPEPRAKGLTGVLGTGFGGKFGVRRSSSPELKAFGIAFELFAMFGAGLLLGYLADQVFGSEPKGILIGAVVGLITGIYQAVRDGLRVSRELDQRRDQDRDTRGR